MYVFQDHSQGFQKARSHPYVETKRSKTRFVDFKRQPELIGRVLEDFVPFGHEPAIQTFYQFLTWINGPDSLLESCDCAFRGPETHDFELSPHQLIAHGRLMLMYRDLQSNCDDRLNKRYNSLGRELSVIDPEFVGSQGSVCFSFSRALFLDLISIPPGKKGKSISRTGDPGRGYQVMLHFKAFGNDSDETFMNLDRVFKNIELACRRSSEQMRSC